MAVCIVPKLELLTIITGPVESIIKLLSEISLLVLPAISVAIIRTLAKLVSTTGTDQEYGLEITLPDFSFDIVCQVEPLLIEYSKEIFWMPLLSFAVQMMLYEDPPFILIPLAFGSLRLMVGAMESIVN